MSRPADYPWWMPAAAAGGAGLVRALGATWSIDRSGLAAYDARIASGERCIFAFWHARMLPLVYTHRGRGIAVLVSRHRDGELITRIIEHLGFQSARGSSSRGGEEGVREMVWLAAHLGWPVVPAATAARSARRLRSWDGFRIPRPFTRVVAAYGEPIHVAAGATRSELEHDRVRIEEALAALTREVDARAGGVR